MANPDDKIKVTQKVRPNYKTFKESDYDDKPAFTPEEEAGFDKILKTRKPGYKGAIKSK